MMASDQTQQQSPDELHRSRDLSVQPTRPPAQISGYLIEKFIGSGAYGEVWSATNKKTGRKVAIKFYSRRSSADIQLLAREVEKLAVLAADRYVVQLLDVGWDVEPPYFVMDYIEHGSLEDRLNQIEPIPTAHAVELFQEVATAMMHLHGKGILHCDLKPGNVLLDQDGKPRVADFGQSRLSTEQTPALGTLFFMAPEQADLDAVPDAKWDVYGLGALLFCMLTGKPPYFCAELADRIEGTQDITHRLANYREALQRADKPTEHRKVPGVDRMLADVIDRCIAVDPDERYSSVQSVLYALQNRETVRARRPLVALGLLGPLLLISVMTLFGWWAFRQAVGDSEKEITLKANESNLFAARLAARSAAEQIDEYFRVVRQLARDEDFLAAFVAFDKDPELIKMRRQLADPNQNDPNRFPELHKIRIEFIANKLRQKLQPFLEEKMVNLQGDFPRAASWFVNDREGNQVASVFEPGDRVETLGKNWSYRTYFTGLDRDQKTKSGNREVYTVSEDIESRQMIDRQHLSAIFLSKASNTWKVAFSAPIVVDGQIRGVVAATAEVGDFVEFKNDGQMHYAILVDDRAGDTKGTVLEHPLFDEILKDPQRGRIPESLTRCVVDIESIPDKEMLLDGQTVADHPRFVDPVGVEPDGRAYNQEAIASKAAVTMRDYSATNAASPPATQTRSETGLYVVAVQNYQSVTEPAQMLGRRLGRLALLASLFLLAVALGMWLLVARMLRESRQRLSRSFSPSAHTSPARNLETIALAGQTKPHSGPN
jgi:hypothetical protein